MEAWQRLRGAIVDAAAEDACRPIIDWLRAALARSGPDALSPLMFPEPLVPLPDELLLAHRHRLLLSHLPDRLRNSGPRSTVYAGVKAGQVAQEQPVPVL